MKNKSQPSAIQEKELVFLPISPVPSSQSVEGNNTVYYLKADIVIGFDS
ncbi:MAG: hypothetical protein ACKO2Z_01340 [Sphaerospermopsis kisseleviana]